MQPQVQTQGQSRQVQPNQSQISQQLLSQNMQTNIGSGAQGSASLTSSMPPVSNLSNGNISASLDSTAQTGNANGGDWQEEVYQKIQAMKEMYLPDLNEIYQRVAARLQQHDSLPQQQNPEQVDKLKLIKTLLERLISFLSVSKSNILPPLKEKLGDYEKQIISFLNPTRPRRPPQQGQVLPHDVQVTSQSPQMNTQGSVPRTQQATS